MQERKFYPMITNTLKNILCLVNPEDMWEIMTVICQYPNHSIDGNLAAKPIIDVIIDELDRQYVRWNKRGAK